MNFKLTKATRIVAFILLLSSCGNNSNRNQDREANQKEEFDKKAIRSFVEEKGDMIARSSQKALGSQLKKAIRQGGVSNAIKYCNKKAYPLIDSLQEKYSVAIKRASHKLRNPQDAPDKHEQKILTTYLDKLAKDQTMKPVVTSIADNKMLYAKPIMLDKPLCLNCHGEVGKQLSKKDFALIRDLYPNDSAHNHQLGDLRGIWSITFPKKEIIEKLQQQTGKSSG